jgi:hypothetical protein
LEDEVDVLRVGGQVGAIGARCQPAHELAFETERGADGRQVRRLASVEIDPQQLSILDPPDRIGAEIDLVIVAVGVVQPAAQAGPGLVRGDQWTTARRTATASASNAMPYWKMSIARSDRCPVDGITTSIGFLCPMAWRSIDVAPR